MGIARLTGGDVRLLHAGEESKESREKLGVAIQEAGYADVPVYFHGAQSPAESLLAMIREQEVDLLVLGALPREPEKRNFVGGVARILLREAPCDLLIFSRPMRNRKNYRNVMAYAGTAPDGDFLQRALEFSRHAGAEAFCLTGLSTPFDVAYSDQAEMSEEDLEEQIIAAGGFEGQVEARLIRSNTGFGLCEFIENVQPDLFCLQSEFAPEGRRLCRHLDWLYQVIPSNVWVITRR